MKTLRQIAWLSSMIPILWMLIFGGLLCHATIIMGHIPSIGDEELYHPILSFFQILKLLLTLIGFVAVPTWGLILIHLCLHQVQFKMVEKIGHILAFISMLLFLSFKFIWTEQFLWVNG